MKRCRDSKVRISFNGVEFKGLHQSDVEVQEYDEPTMSDARERAWTLAQAKRRAMCGLKPSVEVETL